MPEPPFFSVIIPTCNRPQTLAQCLRKLETQTPQAKFHFETLVGDDSPTPERGTYSHSTIPG